MKEPNCFPPAEYNPSSLTPTSLSQSLMAMHELLYPRPQLSLPIPSGSQEMMYLLLNPVAAPLPNTSRTSSSSPHCFFICDLFACLLFTTVTNTSMLSQQTPSSFTLHPGAMPRPILPDVQQLSGTHLAQSWFSWVSTSLTPSRVPKGVFSPTQDHIVFSQPLHPSAEKFSGGTHTCSKNGFFRYDTYAETLMKCLET